MTSVSGRLRAAIAVVAVFVVLTGFMTWPQARTLASRAVPHQDVYFNMWRLAWIAHVSETPSARLFDGNIFYPERRTLALSDAMLVEGAAAAPLFWMRMRPVLIHNLMMLGPIALSGAALFALVVYLTGSRGAGLLAGIAFAFAPYRFEHLMHMELQWTIWMPLAFFALHKTLETGRLSWGLTTGLMIALQMLSSIYYGIFLATLFGICGALLLMVDRRVTLRRALVPLAAGAALALVISAAYAIPYLKVRDEVGERPQDQVVMFSARPSNYLVATPTNWLYGRMFESRGRGERRLFPGLVVVVLAIAGLLLEAPSARAMIYLLALVTAFEASLGFSGYVYRFLFDYVPAYRGLRAPARLGIFVVMFLGILAGYGYATIARSLHVNVRRALLVVLAVAMLIEYSVTIPLTAYPNTAPPVYRYLAQHPRGVVAEFPFPRADELPGPDPEYAYLSIFHWFPLVNGYSGIHPPSYLARLSRLRQFPDATSQAQLHYDGVRYVIVHTSGYRPEAVAGLLDEVYKAGPFRQLGVFDDGDGPAYLFSFR